MPICTYDNPSTMARECWQDGRLLCRYKAQLLPPFAKDAIPAEYFFMGANIGEWKTGRIVGDSSAIDAAVMSRPKFRRIESLNELRAVGLNPFAVQLVAESMLRSSLAPISPGDPVTFFLPVHRKDCEGWSGVKITLEAVRAEASAKLFED